MPEIPKEEQLQTLAERELQFCLQAGIMESGFTVCTCRVLNKLAHRHGTRGRGVLHEVFEIAQKEQRLSLVTFCGGPVQDIQCDCGPAKVAKLGRCKACAKARQEYESCGITLIPSRALTSA